VGCHYTPAAYKVGMAAAKEKKEGKKKERKKVEEGGI
jgi:hypothetical protein